MKPPGAVVTVLSIPCIIKYQITLPLKTDKIGCVNVTFWAVYSWYTSCQLSKGVLRAGNRLRSQAIHTTVHIISISFVFLYDTFKMVTEATEICRWIEYDKTRLGDGHLLV